MVKTRLPKEQIVDFSGTPIRHPAVVPPLRDDYYFIVDQSVSGDAPKDFIKVYSFGLAKKRSRSKWPAYVAKVGHKWYPNESITEHLLTRIGQQIGLNMAESRLMDAHGQIRFLSKYFLDASQLLVHGAQIFSGYLEDDKFVDEVEAAGKSREFFTVQFVHESFIAGFPHQCDALFEQFCRMLAFDAIVGNNDRHFYNWGVVVHISGERKPVFSPIYDSARGLFWNTPETKLEEIEHNHDPNRRRDFISKYVLNSRPKTGLESSSTVNHFELVQGVLKEFPSMKSIFMNLYQPKVLINVSEILGTEFAGLVSELRKSFIMECLELRLKRYHETISAG